jgi:hypothetical protein
MDEPPSLGTFLNAVDRRAAKWTAPNLFSMSGDVSFEELLGRLRRLGGVWESDAAQATENESARPVRLQLSEAAFADQAASTVAQWAQDVRSTKGRMGEANSAAHAEIDAFLKNRNGRPVGYVTVLLAKWRTAMEEYDAGSCCGRYGRAGLQNSTSGRSRNRFVARTRQANRRASRPSR